jgi:hypothetical protein
MSNEKQICTSRKISEIMLGNRDGKKSIIFALWLTIFCGKLYFKMTTKKIKSKSLKEGYSRRKQGLKTATISKITRNS